MGDLKGEELARKWGVPYIETSAKARVNIEEAISTLVGIVPGVSESRYVDLKIAVMGSGMM